MRGHSLRKVHDYEFTVDSYKPLLIAPYDVIPIGGLLLVCHASLSVCSTHAFGIENHKVVLKLLEKSPFSLTGTFAGERHGIAEVRRGLFGHEKVNKGPNLTIWDDIERAI